MTDTAAGDPGPIPDSLQRKLMEYEPHPLALMFPPMVGPEFNELVEDISKHGQLEPIRLYEGKILDGRNRYVACQRLRKEVWAVEYEGDDPKGYVIAMNVRRRHLTAEDKRRIIGELLKENPQASDRQIAAIANVDNKTVAAEREKLEGREEIPHVETRTDTTGREQPASKSKGQSNRKPMSDPVVEAIRRDPLRVLELAFNGLCDTELAVFVSKWKSKYSTANQVFALIEDWEDIELILLMETIKEHVGHRLLAKQPEAGKAEAEKAEAV